MAIFSRTCEYAIRAVLYIAHQSTPSQKIGIKEIAAGIDSPELYLAKILQNLSKKGIINSTKGPHGGFYIQEDSLRKPLSEIVEAIDGEGLFRGCALGLSQCSELNPCPLHDQFKSIRTQIHQVLSQTTIGEFNQELVEGILSLRK